MQALSYDELTSFSTPGPVTESHQRFCCPLCGHNKPRDSKHQCLCLNVTNSRWQCWRCGCWGILGITFNGEVLPPEMRTQKPANGSGPVLPKSKPAIHWRKKYADVLNRLRPIAGTPGETYGQSRGFNLDTLIAGQVRYCSDFLGGRAIVFPVRNAVGNLVGMQGRYINPKPDQPKTRTLGMARKGAFWTPSAWEDPRGVVLCEAPIDALTLHQLGRPAVASLGVSAMPNWVLEMCAGQSVAIATDNDEAGERAAQQWAQALQQHKSEPQRARPPGEHHDWNEYLQTKNNQSCQTHCPPNSTPTAKPHCSH